jgi:two-component system, chemotaxis family, protein-glutamate methylesterase/glutaminase
MPARRDIVVIGASLGGVEALSELVALLPATLPASVLVVQHTSEESPGLLSGILTRRGPLRAVTAEDGMTLSPGTIYVAPPNRHLLVGRAGIRVTIGPRENRSRPAIDPLFRTAAVHYRQRVVGIVLTGLLSDGAAGLLAIKRCGGVAVVQTPEDAVYPEMPVRALAKVEGADQVALAEMGDYLVRCLASAPPDPPPVPDSLKLEVELTERAMRSDDWTQIPGEKTDFSCPECGGPIRQIDDPLRRYRCRVGHAFSPEAMVSATGAALEESLWVALQTLQERAQLLETMARDDQARGFVGSATGLAQRATETRMHAERFSQFLGDLLELEIGLAGD